MPVLGPRLESTRAPVCLLPRPVRMGSLAPLRSPVNALNDEQAQHETPQAAVTALATRQQGGETVRPLSGRGAWPHGRRAAAGLLHCRS